MAREGITGMNHIGFNQNHGPCIDLMWPAGVVKSRAAVVNNAYGVFGVSVSTITVARIDADAQLCPRDGWVAMNVVLAIGRHRVVSDHRTILTTLPARSTPIAWLKIFCRAG